MSDFSTFIEQETALGRMAQNIVVTAPNGTAVLFYVIPGGSDGSGRDLDTIRIGFLDEDGNFDGIGRSAGVAEGTPLNLILTTGGPVVQYQSAFNDDINQVRLQDANAPGFNPVEVQFISPVTEFSAPAVNPGLVVIGSGNADSLVGTSRDDVIVGQGGDDVLYGRGGDDELQGGTGADQLFGGGNNDFLNGGAGEDLLYGDAGADVMHGGNGADVMFGGFGSDLMYGGKSNDLMFGMTGADELRGGTGNDDLYGGDGSDVLRGNKGQDSLYGGRSNDLLYGDDGNDILSGGTGRDEIHGGAGHDVLLGGRDSDRLIGGTGADTFVFTSRDSAGTDRIADFGNGNDVIDISSMGLTFETLELRQRDDDTIITARDVQIRLEGFDVTDLGADDFLF